MTSKEIINPVKLSSKCSKVKDLAGGFYKAGKSWQKYCKICHNDRRSDYSNNRVYVAKPTGFKKLPEALQTKIIYDIHVRVNFKDIWRKYSPEHPKLRHQTLLRWAKLGQIPPYTEPTPTPTP